MELFKIDYQGQPLRLEGSMAGWQQLFWNNQLVSHKPASSDPNGQYIHEFDIVLEDDKCIDSDVSETTSNSPHTSQPPSTSQPPPISQPPPNSQAKVQHCRIQAEIQWQPFEVTYQLFVDDELVTGGKRSYKDIEKQVPFEIPKAKRPFNLFGLTTLAVKLFKSAKVIKLALATSSLAVYSWLFSFTFAAALIISLMFHELGRIHAMRHYGIPTKGLYLIPFFGGFAMRDEKANTRWQAMVIALAGPSFGLFMSLFYMLVYGITGNLLFAALASFNALLNLFNLLPVLPLAGGHVLKNISFSMNSRPSALLCIVILGIGAVATFQAGLLLFTALLVVGGAEIMVAWRHRHTSHLLPLDHYGQAFSFVWYCLLLLCFVGVIWFFAGMGDDMLGLPLKLLQI